MNNCNYCENTGKIWIAPLSNKAYKIICPYCKKIKKNNENSRGIFLSNKRSMSNKLKITNLIKGKVHAPLGFEDTIFDEENNHIIDIRGYGRFKYDPELEDRAQREIGKFVIEAINEKLERIKEV